MALRIAVNRELERLEEFFDRLPGILNHGGRLCIVSFHSLEDRIVKQRMKALAEKRSSDPYSNGSRSGTVGILKILTKKVVRPGPAEVAANPMARSAKLRTAERV
jgi:16S rRNA (cytosine1402-N4)-methyltransferase